MNMSRHVYSDSDAPLASNGERARTLDDDICVHVLTSSSSMVGVCLTVVGIFHVVTTLKKADLIGDDLLAINAMMYLAAALLAYCGLRTRNRRRNHRLEYTADIAFLAGMVFTVINTAFITWAMCAA
jgi:hypothetical protein